MVELEWRERFKVFVERRLDRLADIEDGLTIRAVIIAHIHADGEEEGEITKEIIRRYRGKAKIFANFGQNQFLLGDSFWKDDLRDVTLFQLSLSEVRKFFGNNDKVNSLARIIHQLKK